MQVSSEQLHQVWLKCMQMNQCSPQGALAFLAQVRPLINFPLTPSGQTLLMLAASTSSLHLVHALLAHKANPAARDSAGRSALHYAASVGSIEIFELLIRSGCGAGEETMGGESPLAKACLFAQSSIIQWYLNNCLAAFERTDRTGRRPLEVLQNSSEELHGEVRQVYEELRGEMRDQLHTTLAQIT